MSLPVASEERAIDRDDAVEQHPNAVAPEAPATPRAVETSPPPEPPKKHWFLRIFSGALLAVGVAALKLKAILILAFDQARTLFVNPFEGFGAAQYAIAGGSMVVTVAAYATKFRLGLVIGFVLITVLLAAGSLNLSDIVVSQGNGLGTRLGLPNSFLDWYWLPLFPMFIVFFISALAETSRPPFDLPEAESELVAGYAVEYSSTPFLLFFLGEYVAICVMCAMTTVLFLGGWLPPVAIPPFTWIPGLVWFVLKATFVFFMFAMVKAFVPRYRYDQLMRLGWKVFLPLSLFMVVLVAAFLKLTGLA